MTVSKSYRDYIMEKLESLGFVTIKKMFGGVGIYCDELIFALIVDDVLYFKVDDSSRLDYEKEGMGPFKPFTDKSIVMPYYEVPPDILENQRYLLEWARKACFASKNYKSKNKKRKEY